VIYATTPHTVLAGLRVVAKAIDLDAQVDKADPDLLKTAEQALLDEERDLLAGGIE
jgi:hypothetical protein